MAKKKARKKGPPARPTEDQKTTEGLQKRLANLTRRGLGRPAGVPNKVTREAKEACNAIVDDPLYRESLRIRMIAGTAGPMELLIWYYAKGKPKERLEVSADEKLSTLIQQAIARPPLPPPAEYVPTPQAEPGRNP
jgi:hypothetical protein